jgi:hypothetical protein
MNTTESSLNKSHEHHGELAEQIAPACKQLLLDQVLDTTWGERAAACSVSGSSSPNKAMA